MQLLGFQFACIFILICFVDLASAYPQDFNCNGSTWKAGQAFGHMLVDKFTASKTDCIIQGVPSEFVPGKKYQIQIISKQSLGHKLVVEHGTLAGDKLSLGESPSKLQTDKCGYRSKQKVSVYLWTAPRISSKDSETFYALCGQFIGPMLVASQVTSKPSLIIRKEEDSELNVHALENQNLLVANA